jgi:hypothetical protein
VTFALPERRDLYFSSLPTLLLVIVVVVVVVAGSLL